MDVSEKYTIFAVPNREVTDIRGRRERVIGA